MENNEDTEPIPDLASVLATLAQFAPVQQQYVPPIQQHATPPVDPRRLQQQNNVAPRPDHQQRQKTPAIRPDTITDWRHGLRCVTQNASSNPQFKATIRAMNADQEKHEKMWFEQRQDLIKAQAARVEGNQKLNAIFGSIGGASVQVDRATEEDNQAELRAYDRKVMRAQHQMVAMMTEQLKGMGVPFFGTRPDLILRDSEAPSEDERPTSRPGSSHGPKITESQLLEYQRKMIQYLEDMYK